MRSRTFVASLSVLALGAAALADSFQSVQLVNSSPYVVRKVFVSRSTHGGWGKNLLTQPPLSPGGTATVRFQGSCGSHDLRIVAEGGIELLEEEFDPCQYHTVTIKSQSLTKSAE